MGGVDCRAGGLAATHSQSRGGRSVGRSRTPLARLGVCAILFGLACVPVAGAASPPSFGPTPESDSALQTATPEAQSSHHGPSEGHLPPQQQNLELVSRLSPTRQFGNIVPGQIADV